MKTLKTTLIILLFVFGTTTCTEDIFNSENELTDDVSNNEFLKSGKNANLATGSVEIIWKGGGKDSNMGSDMGIQTENLRAFFEFDVHEVIDAGEPKGEVVFIVTEQDLTFHREIRAQVKDVYFMPGNPTKGWFVARVTSDSKGCNGGSGPGGHDNGCSDDHTTDEGGCSDDHTTDEGGCSGSDMGGEEHPGSTGSTVKGNSFSGKNCRLGQLIIVKIHDMATPGKDPDGDGILKGDALSWKWYAPDHEYDIYIEPKPLCKKTIIEGNLVVHN